MHANTESSNESSDDLFGIGYSVINYFVTDKFGHNLKYLVSTFEGKLPSNDVLKLGLKILEAFKIMHESGVVYNNLKAEHVLVGDGQFTEGSRD